MSKACLSQCDPGGLRVLMRVDFNVPLDRNGNITDDTRILAALPSLQYVLEARGSLVLMSHLGRPAGTVRPECTLRPVADRLAELLSFPVKFACDAVGPDARVKCRELRPGEVLLLENLRFDSGETDNDTSFAAALAQHGDVYVNDAFATAHRAHASTVGTALLFERRYAGLLMQRELENLGALLTGPPRPFTAIIGGVKMQGKIEVIRYLLPRVDNLLLGGAMVFPFLQVMGLNIGNSLLDAPSMAVVQEILAQARSSRGRLVLPTDVIVSSDFSAAGQRQEVLISDIPDRWQGLDVGTRSIEMFAEIIASSKAVFWSGPMGVFEIPVFSRGTMEVGRAIAEVTALGARSVVGGGDTVAALRHLRLADRISHLSTSGAASLEFMGGRGLPGVDALSDA